MSYLLTILPGSSGNSNPSAPQSLHDFNPKEKRLLGDGWWKLSPRDNGLIEGLFVRALSATLWGEWYSDHLLWTRSRSSRQLLFVRRCSLVTSQPLVPEFSPAMRTRIKYSRVAVSQDDLNSHVPKPNLGT